MGLVDLLKGKNIAVVANQTSVIDTRNKKQETRHLVDSLLSLGIKVKKVFVELGCYLLLSKFLKGR